MADNGGGQRHLPTPIERLRQYHLRELEIALSSREPNTLPDIPVDVGVVLDVGCGAGQTLFALAPRGGLVRIGIDVDSSVLGILRQQDSSAMLAAGRGEAIPIASVSCDVVYCRVARPYMHVDRALREMARVLKPGGWLWLTLHPASTVLKDLRRDLSEWRLRGVLYRIFVLANGMLLNTTGYQLRYPLNRARMETFQTSGGIRRMLHRAGFEILSIDRTITFVVKARRACAE